MTNTKLKSILLGSTIFCICTFSALSTEATTVNLNNEGAQKLTDAISIIQTKTNSGTTGSYSYTLPSSASTDTIVPPDLGSSGGKFTSINNPNQLTINGNTAYNQVIKGTLAIKNPGTTATTAGKLTINNVGSFTQNGLDYNNVTTDKIAGHIENLTNYLQTNGTNVKYSDAAAVHLVDSNLEVNNSIFAFSDTTKGTNLSEQGAAIHIRKELSSTNPQATIKGSTFAFNASNDNGAAINAENANITISDATTFIGNTATSHGGAIDIAGRLNIDGGTQPDKSNIFYNNSATVGGAVFIHDNTTVTSTSNVYDSNTATTQLRALI